jgi:large subunit ribosomal protein L15
MGTTLHTLTPNPGATRIRKRIGRGHGSGTHKTAGKGQKGQKARTGHHGIPKPGFEGGQTIMARRLPKRGFKSPFRREIFAVNIDDIAARFPEGTLITPENLKQVGLVPRSTEFVKILSRGELTFSVKIRAHYFSASAREKITNARGVAEQINIKGKNSEEGALT